MVLVYAMSRRHENRVNYDNVASIWLWLYDRRIAR